MPYLAGKTLIGWSVLREKPWHFADLLAGKVMISQRIEGTDTGPGQPAKEFSQGRGRTISQGITTVIGERNRCIRRLSPTPSRLQRSQFMLRARARAPT